MDNLEEILKKNIKSIVSEKIDEEKVGIQQIIHSSRFVTD